MKASRRCFESSEYANRQQAVRAAMAERGLDLLIIYDPSNLCWLTGYDAWTFYVHQCVVIGVQGELFWFGRGIDAPAARLTTDLAPGQIIAYPDHYVQAVDIHPMDYLADLLKQRQLHTGRIGVEKDNYYFSARAMESLNTHLADAQFVDATALVNWQRAVKSPQELDYMRRAGKVVAKVYERIMEVAEQGKRMNQVIDEFKLFESLCAVLG